MTNNDTNGHWKTKKRKTREREHIVSFYDDNKRTNLINRLG